MNIEAQNEPAASFTSLFLPEFNKLLQNYSKYLENK